MKDFIKIKNLSVEFPILSGPIGKKKRTLRAVQDVTIDIFKGETLGLVGESGCGKSTLGKALLRLVESSFGSVHYEGTEILRVPQSSFRAFRRKIQIIFQDPFSSLNPRMTIGETLKEPLIVHQLEKPADQKSKAIEALQTVGLTPDAYDRYPHEFSGGQRQRIGIARALMVKPDFIVADEPVSALDVSIQAQVLNLLRDLRDNFQLTYLFISHDLNVVRYFCDRVVVMYLGRIMEIIPRDKLIEPKFNIHPYTRALIESVPKKHPSLKATRPPLLGDIPSPVNPPTGCVFHTRCPEAKPECAQIAPQLRQVSGRLVACHLR